MMPDKFDATIENLINPSVPETPTARRLAVKQLFSGGPDAVNALIQAMYQQPAPMRRSYRRLLAEYALESQDRMLIEPMLTLVGSEDPLLAQTALEALEIFGDEVWERLLSQLFNANPVVRVQIVYFVRQFGGLAAIEPLMILLQTVDSSALRYTAIEALSELGTADVPGLVELIRSFQDDADHHVRDRVASALESLQA